VEKEAGSQIDPPSFYGMLHISVGFYGIVGEMSGSAVEAWLEHIKGFHLPCAGFLGGYDRSCALLVLVAPAHIAIAAEVLVIRPSHPY